MFVVGAAIATIFAILVAYPEVLAKSRENSALISSNEEQIELLWNAHSIVHLEPITG
jgi:hypothetical protein